MSNQLQKKLSDELKQERTKKNITIEHIFTKTRIDKKFLAAIEEGNFDVMPEVYIRAFLKQYANTVGIDAKDVLDKFEKVQNGIDYSAETEEDKKAKQVPQEKVKKVKLPIEETNTSKETSKPKAKTNSFVYYAIASILMLFFIFVIYKVFLTEQKNEIITEKPFEEIVSEQNGIVDNEIEVKTKSNENLPLEKIEPKQPELLKQEKTDSTKIVQQQAQTPNYTNGLVLTIIGSEKSWIRAVADEKENSEFIIENSVTKVLNAKEKFYLHIGNSGGVKVLLNNKDLNFTGASGRVRKIYVTKNGIEYLQRTPTVNEKEE